MFDFRVKPYFPKTLSQEFLLVDLVNNVERLAENKSRMLKGVKKKARFVDHKVLKKAVYEYGGAKAKKFFAPILAHDTEYC